MSALDILSEHSGEAVANSDPLSQIFPIGKPSNYAQGVPPTYRQAPRSETRMTHVNEYTCPKCNSSMEEALIGQEVVYFCAKHAVTMPKRIA